jgi:hypothetical protein
MGLINGRVKGTEVTQEIEAPLMLDVGCQPDIFEDAQILKEAILLKGPPNTDFGHLIRF